VTGQILKVGANAITPLNGIHNKQYSQF